MSLNDTASAERLQSAFPYRGEGGPPPQAVVDEVVAEMKKSTKMIAA